MPAKNSRPHGRALIPTLPVRLRQLREAAGLSRGALARAAGTSDSAIVQLERGERSPSLELAGRLADVLGVTVDELRRAAPEKKNSEKSSKKA